MNNNNSRERATNNPTHPPQPTNINLPSGTLDQGRGVGPDLGHPGNCGNARGNSHGPNPQPPTQTPDLRTQSS